MANSYTAKMSTAKVPIAVTQDTVNYTLTIKVILKKRSDKGRCFNIFFQEKVKSRSSIYHTHLKDHNSIH